MLLQISGVQRILSNIVLKELSAKLETKVSIGQIHYKLFNTLSVNDLYVQDRKKDTLLYAEKFDISFKFWKIFKGELIVKSVELDKLSANIHVDKNGKSNAEFLIKAFSKESKDSTHFEYQIERLKLRQSTFKYKNERGETTLKKNLININNLKISNINSDIVFKLLNSDSLYAKINSFSALEQSGLAINEIKTTLFGNKKGISIPNFLLVLPSSKIELKDINLKYNRLTDIRDLIHKVKCNANILPSYINPMDIKQFFPLLATLKDEVNFKGELAGQLSNLHLRKLQVNYGKAVNLSADIDLNGLPEITELFIYAQIKNLTISPLESQDLISGLIKQPFIMPESIKKLGAIRYAGNVTGFISNLVTYGNFHTNLGSVSTDILIQLKREFKDLKYSGLVLANNFQLGKLLNNPHFGKISFKLKTDGSKTEKNPFKGNINAGINSMEFNQYNYKNIAFDGKYDGKGFDGKIDINDENLNAEFKGLIDLTQKLPIYNFDLQVQNAKIHELNLSNKYKNSNLSFSSNINMIGNSLDNVNGLVELNNIQFKNKDKLLKIDKIKLVSRTTNDYSSIIVSSDIVNGTMSGKFKYSTLGSTINRFLRTYIPSFTERKPITEVANNHINIDFNINLTDDFSEIIEMPYNIRGTSTFNGYIDDKLNKIDITGNIPKVTTNKPFLENIVLHIENIDNELKLNLHSLLHSKFEVINLFANVSARNDSIISNIGWQNSRKVTNAGEIKVLTAFKSTEEGTSAHLSILPTQIIISDSTWNIHRSSVDFKADSSIQINNFLFDCNHQFISINGRASSNKNDSVLVTMNKLQLEFIMTTLLNLRSVTLGGLITGQASLHQLMKEPMYNANVFVEDFTLNGKLIGDANLKSRWDRDNNLIHAGGDFINKTTNSLVVRADGVYIPKNDSLDFLFDAQKMSLAFLNRYFDAVVDNFDGYATGKIRMLGASRVLGFQGDALVTNAKAKIKVLNSNFYFDDSVHLTRKNIKFKNIKFYDQDRNQGYINAMIQHNGSFQQLTYTADLAGKNLLGLNTTSKDNEYFFGKAYIDGNVHINGDGKVCNITVNGSTQPKTHCYVNMSVSNKATDNSFIHFINKKKTAYIPENKPINTPSLSGGMNVKVNFKIDITPQADLELIVDSKGGDVITGKGSGNLQLDFDTFSPIKLYGTYTIDNGYYLFTMQNLIRRDFKIDKGSTLSWTGDPFSAQVNIQAIYSLTASLKDLDQSLLSQNRASVPVNCILKLTDNIMKPTIKFDVKLPQCDETVQQQVKNIINTNEMMNLQIMYLLLFNQFYSPEYLQTASTTNNNNNNFPSEAISFGLTTLSSQLNNWISKASRNFTIGLGFKPSDKATNEYQVQTQLLYQPNDRLIINGNFGYSNENANSSTNNNKFIGDVDVEYLLTESGHLRLKAYNHTVDRYRLITAKTTQGVGFLYKQDFSTVGEMVSYYWGLTKNIGKKKTKNEKK